MLLTNASPVYLPEHHLALRNRALASQIDAQSAYTAVAITSPMTPAGEIYLSAIRLDVDKKGVLLSAVVRPRHPASQSSQACRPDARRQMLSTRKHSHGKYFLSQIRTVIDLIQLRSPPRVSCHLVRLLSQTLETQRRCLYYYGS